MSQDSEAVEITKQPITQIALCDNLGVLSIEQYFYCQ